MGKLKARFATSIDLDHAARIGGRSTLVVDGQALNARLSPTVNVKEYKLCS